MREWLKAKGTMPISDPQLWRRLQAWQRGNGGQRLQMILSAKLKLFPRNAPRVGEEFLRYVYLFARAPEAVTPPPLLVAVMDQLRKEAVAFAALEEASGFAFPAQSQTAPPDERHEAAHPLYRSEFGGLPPPDIWWGAEERRNLSASSRGFWTAWAALLVCGIGIACQNSVLAGIGALFLFGTGAYQILLRLHGPIQAGEGDAF